MTSFAILADGGVIAASRKTTGTKQRLAPKRVSAPELAKEWIETYRSWGVSDENVEASVRFKLESYGISDIDRVLREAGLALSEVGSAAQGEAEAPGGVTWGRRSSSGRKAKDFHQVSAHTAHATPDAPKPIWIELGEDDRPAPSRDRRSIELGERPSLMVEVPVQTSARMELSEQERDLAARVERNLAWLAGR
jgi:hypothetical protein